MLDEDGGFLHLDAPAKAPTTSVVLQEILPSDEDV